MRTQTKQNLKLGDSVVDGLLGGLAGGLAMAVFLVLLEMANGHVMSESLGRFAPAGDSNAVMGTLAHLSVSAIYGAIFGGLKSLTRNRVPDAIAGLAFGALLFLLAWFFLLPGSGTGLLEIPPLIFGLSHLLYGVVLGLVTARNSQSAAFD